jgi:hypothetical protein
MTNCMYINISTHAWFQFMQPWLISILLTATFRWLCLRLNGPWYSQTSHVNISYAFTTVVPCSSIHCLMLYMEGRRVNATICGHDANWMLKHWSVAKLPVQFCWIIFQPVHYFWWGLWHSPTVTTKFSSFAVMVCCHILFTLLLTPCLQFLRAGSIHGFLEYGMWLHLFHSKYASNLAWIAGWPILSSTFSLSSTVMVCCHVLFTSDLLLTPCLQFLQAGSIHRVQYMAMSPLLLLCFWPRLNSRLFRRWTHWFICVMW